MTGSNGSTDSRPWVSVRDVSLRDGLQDERVTSTEHKVAIFEALVAAGVGDLELTSFVRPDRVPAMADADALAAATAGAVDGVEGGVAGSPTRWALVLNARGAERALAAGLEHLQFVVSVSETHQRSNAGRSVAGGIDDLATIRELTRGGAALEFTLATAFGCPYDGPVATDDVLSLVDRAIGLGVDAISLADTIGVAAPSEVATLTAAVVERIGDRPVGMHLHDTRGLAMANCFAALDAGAVRIDAAVGGFGGCPFAPGASGNLAMEDLVHGLHASGIETGIDLDRLLEVVPMMSEAIGRPAVSHVAAAGPRFSSTAVAS